MSRFKMVLLGAGLAALAAFPAGAALKIVSPAAGSVFRANESFAISGIASPGNRISAIRVRVAGQTLSPVGTNRWSVGVTIGRPGVFRIVVNSRIGNRWVAKRVRYVTIVPS